MINRLFSSFDPASSLLNRNWSILLLTPLWPIFNKFFLMSSRKTFLRNSLNILLNKEIKNTLNNTNTKEKIFWLRRIFFSILILNLLGLIPYIFRVTAHIIFTLTLALPLWFSFIIFSLKNSTQNFFAHLVPSGTPIALSHFMVIIETIRQLIRPITLSVRLAANITAGHILIILMSNTIFFINPVRLTLIILFLLELAVAFIQSYVFTLLTSIYLNETTYETKPLLSLSLHKTMTYFDWTKHIFSTNENNYFYKYKKKLILYLHTKPINNLLFSMMTRHFTRKILSRISLFICNLRATLRNNSFYYFRSILFPKILLKIFSLLLGSKHRTRPYLTPLRNS